MNNTDEPTPTWRIVCVKRETVAFPRPHVHIVGVGTGERPGWADMRWTLRQVLAALEDGEGFYLQDEATGQTIRIEKSQCPICEKTCIRSVANGSLAEIRDCAYKTDAPVSFSES